MTKSLILKPLVFFLMLSALGCTSKQANPQYAAPSLNEVKIISEGGEFFRRETVSADSKEAKLVKLTLLKLSELTFSLRYQEFTKATNGRYSTGETWTLKEEFDSKYECKAGSLIKFKDYQFEILTVENGSIKYIRTM